MKKIIYIILITLITIMLSVCSDTDDTADGLCKNCGGTYTYKQTINFLNDTYYYYVCNTCGKETRTETWRGK